MAILVLDVNYFPRSLVSQAYEIRVQDQVAVFTGHRNVKTSGVHSYRISPEQYDAVLQLVRSSAFAKSESRETSYYGYVGEVTTRLDGVTRKTSIDASTNFKPFLIFRSALEDILGIRSYRCPYEPPVGDRKFEEICAYNDALEEKVLKGH